MMKIKIDTRPHRMKIFNLIRKGLMSKLFKFFVLFCILSSIAAIIGSSFRSMAHYDLYMFGVTYLSALVFLIEYILRIISAPAKYPGISIARARFRYILSFYGFVDFVAILPFLLVYLYWNTEIIHVIILPYIFTIFKLIRYSKSFQLIGKVLSRVKDELITAYTACGIMVCFSAILMYYIERSAQPDAFRNIGDGLWWAIVAFTTVGYGDIYPITPLGKMLSSIISLIGIAMIALPTGIISSAFMNQMQEKQKKGNENKDEEHKKQEKK